jgi:hypothetical protein
LSSLVLLPQPAISTAVAMAMMISFTALTPSVEIVGIDRMERDPPSHRGEHGDWRGRDCGWQQSYSPPPMRSHVLAAQAFT